MKNSLFYCLALVLIIGCQPLEKNGYISIKNWTNAPITDLKITYISAQKTYSLGTLYPYSEYKYAINYEQHNEDSIIFSYVEALLHKDLKCKAPLIEPNLRRNLGKWST